MGLLIVEENVKIETMIYEIRGKQVMLDSDLAKLYQCANETKNKIILIDGYANKTVLDIISKINIKVILITKTKNNLKQIDIDKYNKQYHNLEIIYNDTFRDRYFILDDFIVYHCGASLNFAGAKTFSINKLEDKEVI